MPGRRTRNGRSRGVPVGSRTTLALIAALAIALAAPLAAPAPVIAQAIDFAAGDTVVVNTDALNMRTGPGTETAVTAVLVNGTIGTVTDGPIIGPDWTWFEIEVGGVGAGWVAGEFLALSDAADSAFPIGALVEVATDALNLRDGPSLAAAVIVTLPSGWVGRVQDGPVAADGYTWYELFVGLGGESSAVGWVAGEFLALSDIGTTFPNGTFVAVNTDILNVRAEPGLAGRIVDAIGFGATGQVSRDAVVADGYTWYRLRLAIAADGWVAGEFLVLAESGELVFPIGSDVQVDTDVLNVRAEPGLDGRVVDAIFFGDIGEVSRDPVSADGYTWYRLRLPNAADGWVAGEFLVAV